MTWSITLSRRSSSFISSPDAVDHLEDVDAFLVVADLVGQLAAAPVLGLLDGAVEPADDALHLLVQLGDLLVGRLGRDDVDELVRARTHVAPSGR